MQQKSITVNLIANVIKTLMSVLFPLITFPYASRMLGATGIGRVNYASSIVTYFALLASLGISTYAIREGARIRDDKERFNKFAKEILHINLVTTVVSYAALAVFLNIPILEGYHKLMVIFSAGIVFTTIGMEWLFIIQEEYSYITVRAILFQVVSLVLLFLLVKSKEDYYWYAALTVISSGGSAILNLYHSRKFINWRQKAKYEYMPHVKPIILIFGTSLASSIYMTMDTTMLGALSGDRAVGVYTAAVKINLVVSTLIGAVSSTILPRVSYYIGSGLRDKYEKLMKTSVDILLLASMPAVVGMICTSDILILLFSGKEFVAGNLAAKILSAKVVVGALNRVLAYQVCTPYKKDKEVLISTTAGAAFNLVANAVLIPICGVAGAASATLFSEIAVFVLLTKYANTIVSTKHLYRRLPIYLLASIPFIGVRMLVDTIFTNPFAVLGVTIGVCVMGYGALLWIMRDPYIETYKDKIIQRLKKGKI